MKKDSSTDVMCTIGRCNKTRYNYEDSVQDYILAETLTYKYCGPVKWKSRAGASECHTSTSLLSAAIEVGRGNEEDDLEGDVLLAKITLELGSSVVIMMQLSVIHLMGQYNIREKL